MKTKIFAATVAAATVFAASAHAQNWSAAAAQDLQGIHDTLRDSSPAAVADRDNAQFKAWLDAGLAQVKALPLNQITNDRGYGYALRAYTGGFRDPNIDAFPIYAPQAPWYAIDWPGFSLAWRGGAYVVAWTTPGDNKQPPLGAKLISCDKVPAETIAMKRLDRFEGNLKLESDRVKTAPYLLWNRANPFVDALVQKCDFDVGGRKRTIQINSQIGGEPLRKQAYEAAAPKPDGIGMEPFAGGFWINLHTMADGQDWNGFTAKLEAARDAIHAAPIVVIDMRGAEGGNLINGYRVANWIWNPDYITANQPRVTQLAYRVSPQNIKFYQEVLAHLQSDDNYYAERPKWESLVASLNQAQAAGQPLFTRDESGAPVTPAPENPLKGKVIVLTDSWCTSACLDMMDLFSKLPNVTQAGGATSVNSIFIGREDILLPSGQGRVSFGGKAWLDRPRNSTTAYTPAAAMTYTGAPGDEAAYKAWVQSIAH